jgi:quercetin dioxygenase-like cupin family protein
MNQPSKRKPKLPPAQAHALSALIDYAEGGVVSRTLVENPSGTITLFAFDEGQGLSEHTAPFDAFVHVLDGRAEFTVGGKSIPASSGDVLLLPAAVPHAVSAASRFKMLLTMLRSRPSN